VLTEDYAAKIARDWNVRQRGAGFVTRFLVLQPDFRVSNASGHRAAANLAFISKVRYRLRYGRR